MRWVGNIATPYENVEAAVRDMKVEPDVTGLDNPEAVAQVAAAKAAAISLANAEVVGDAQDGGGLYVVLAGFVTDTPTQQIAAGNPNAVIRVEVAHVRPEHLGRLADGDGS